MKFQSTTAGLYVSFTEGCPAVSQDSCTTFCAHSRYEQLGLSTLLEALGAAVFVLVLTCVLTGVFLLLATLNIFSFVYEPSVYL